VKLHLNLFLEPTSTAHYTGALNRLSLVQTREMYNEYLKQVLYKNIDWTLTWTNVLHVYNGHVLYTLL